jgi:hypothetical protein
MAEHDVEYWLQRADEARAQAQTARDPVTRQLLEELAQTLESLADLKRNDGPRRTH